MPYRFFCIIIGYIFGMFLTAEIITRKMTGKPCAELGTSGNPGMANVMANLGFKPGIAVLFGDVLKTVLAAVISYYYAAGVVGRAAILYAGLGVTLGHNYPAWNRFKGGKGVATTCTALILFSFPWGAFSDLCGFAGVLLSKYLCIGALVIPVVFACLAFALWGTEVGMIATALALLMAVKHIPDVRKIRSGSVKQINLVEKIGAKLLRDDDEKVSKLSRAVDEGIAAENSEEQPDARFMALAGTGVDGMNRDSDDLVREHITFYGRVQGVGFRYQASYAAKAFGVTGWVENMPDGSVEMEAQGTLLSIGKMLTRLQEGNWIRIDHMDTKEQNLVKGERGFRVRGY